MRRRCGIYGGSFNPIHNGHTRLGKALCDQGLVDELWFLVSPLNPLKQQDTSLLDDRARLRLARLAIGRSRRLRVSDFEMHLPRPSYMVNTLSLLREQHPELEFLLVIGADNWERFPQWYKHEEILQHHTVIIYPRPGYQTEESTLPPGVTLADTPLIDLSSTEIRRRIARGDYDGEGLSPNVWKEIQAKGYYL